MKIVVALDYSTHGEQILTQAIEFAHSMNASLYLIHVFAFLASDGEHDSETPDLTGLATSNISEINFSAWCEMAKHSEQKLHQWVEQAHKAGVQAQGTHVVGQAGPVICAQAEQIQADVIMIGRRSQKLSHHQPLGSVSHYVIQHAPCSVWVIQDTPAA